MNLKGCVCAIEKKDCIFTLTIGIMCAVLMAIPTGFEGFRQADTITSKARVLSVDNDNMYRTMIIRTGIQRLTVEILQGKFKGQVAEVSNILTGKLEIDELYEPGDNVLIEYSAGADGTIPAAFARGHYRLGSELLLVILFVALLILVAGWTGIKAILSFVFAALMLLKVMIPLFLKNRITFGGLSLPADPIPISLAVIALLTAVISFLVGGLNRKGLTTFSGAFLGLVLTGILAMYFTRRFNIHGAIRPYSEILLYSGYLHLNLTRVFISTVFIAASGALMDLSMDIAAAMDEIHRKMPNISMGEHIRSGMRVGRHVVGTMTTTLLMAYSGGYMFLMMYLMSKQIPLPIILNKSLVAAELLNTLVGSFGLVTVAPFTALAGGVIYHIKSATIKRQDAVHTYRQSSHDQSIDPHGCLCEKN